MIAQTLEPFATPAAAGRLAAWAAAQPDIRTVLLTSPRIGPLADLDLGLAIRNVERWAADDAWPADLGRSAGFGEPLLARHRPGDVPMRLVVYSDGTRVDFALRQAGSLPGRLDPVRRVLLDKDGAAPALMRAAAITRPLPGPAWDGCQALIEDFWWEATFAARNMARGQARLARASLERVVKGDLLPRMLVWRGWPFRHGQMPRPGAIHSAIEIACTRPGRGDGWGALGGACDLFHEAASDVASALGCAYPDALEEKARACIRQIRRMEQPCN